MHEVFYKFDSSQKGWYPKPFEKTHINSWNRVLKHSDPAQGNPISVKESPCFEGGWWNRNQNVLLKNVKSKN